MTTQGLPKTWAKDFDDIFFDAYNRHAPEYPAYCNISSNTEDHFIKEGLMISLKSGVEVPEGAPTPFDAFTEGPEKTVYFSEFKLGIQSTQVSLEDDRTGYVSQGIAELGKAMAYTKELKATNILDTAFTGGRLGLDGKNLIVNDHPLYGKDGGTYSNLVTGALSKTTIQQAMDVAEGMVNEQGIPIISRPRALIVHWKNRWKAEELLSTEAELEPYTANNTVNTVNNKGLSWSVNHYLTSETAWFVLCDFYDIRWINRRNLAFDSKPDFNTGNVMHKSDFRALATFFHWRGVVGSTGV